MTRTEFTDLVDEATRDLLWNLDRVVAGSVDAGRTRLRWHRAGAATAAVAVLAVVGLAGSALHGGGADRATDPDPAGPTSSRSASVQVDPSVTPARLTLAVTAAQVPATFASIIPGTITELPNKELDDHDPIIDFDWNGYAVRVGLTSDSYVAQHRVTDPLTRCRTQGSGGSDCTPGEQEGSYEQSSTSTSPPADGGATTRSVQVFLPGGYDVLVMEANAATLKDSALLSADVPLTVDQLREVAYSTAWFDQG